MRNILLLVACLAAAPSHAGVLMVQETTASGTGKPIITRLMLGGQAVRMEAEGAERTLAIYRADKQLFWMCDPKAKTYVEVTKQDLESMAGRMDSALSQMQAQLKDMPAEQRAMVEKMMKQQAGAAKEPSARRYAKKLTGDKVGKWKADRYEWSEGARKETIWTVAAAGAGIAASDLAVLKDMSAFFGKLAKGRAQGLAFDREDSGVKGMPVRSRVQDGSDVTETVLKDLVKSDFAPAVFEIPKGYKKVKP
jgi:hypothetical protein